MNSKKRYQKSMDTTNDKRRHSLESATAKTVNNRERKEQN